jgi:predicted glycoside hydrolase/deacetylase ChbG (UPF0249 family)
MNKLIITADDFGVFPSINEGIKTAILKGKVNSVACIANYKDSLKNVKQLINEVGNKAEIGCHLTISSGKPLTINQHDIFCKGEFFNSFGNLNIDGLEKETDLLEKELKAQLEIFLDNGIKITNLSCHHNTLTFTKKLFNVYLKLAAHYNLPIRSVNIVPKGKDNTYRKILNLLLLNNVSKNKLKEIRDFGKTIHNEVTNFESKINTPNILESSHYGPLPQAGLLDLFKELEVAKKHKALTKFFKKIAKEETMFAELMVHLISSDLYLLEEDDGIDYPGIDQDYFDSRQLEYFSLMSFNLSVFPNITLASWKEINGR